MKTINEGKNNGNVNGSKPTVFSQIMNLHCELRAEIGLEPLPHWKQTAETPRWTKNICRSLRNTILRSILKLRPKGKVNWRNYGRSIGFMERYKTFLAKDMPEILKEEGFNKKVSKKKWKKIQPLLGEKEMRQYYLKILERSPKDRTPMSKLLEEVLVRQLVNLEQHKETAFFHLANQDAKTTKMFLKGMSEGYTIFLNEEGEFSGDDRRANIHFELLAWRHDIEKMRKSVPAKTKNNLFGELKKLPEFKNKTQDWFNDVCKDIKLGIGKPGRPWQFSQA
jgi:hypothetical protein